MNDKLKKIIFIVLGCFVILFLFLFILSSCSKKLTPRSLETEIVENAKEYFNLNKEQLPSVNSVMTLSLGDLVNKGIIDDLDKLMENGTTCSGNLTIENNNNYYMYSPIINCTTSEESYKSSLLKDKLMDDLVTVGNGLYVYNDGYYYRGDKVDNYVIFDGILWRVIKINNDNSIKLIEVERRDPVMWDDRFNTETKSNTGINNYYFNNLNSRIKDYLESVYNSTSLLTNDAKGYIKESTLCIGKRTLTDETKDGSTECATTLNNQYVGLIQLNEYLIASLDDNCLNADSSACSNYNYLADFDNTYWTITADAETTNKVYKIQIIPFSSSANNTSMPRLVINVSENVVKWKFKLLCWKENYIIESHDKDLDEMEIKSDDFINYQKSYFSNIEPIPVDKIGCSLPFNE